MRRLALCLLGAVLLWAPAGCDDGDELCRPAVPAARLQGHVRTGGLALAAEIGATRIVDGVASPRPLVAVPDERGFYFLDVPAGRYVLALREGCCGWYVYGGGTLGYGDAPPDTLDLGAAQMPRVIDFYLGGLILDLGLSHVLDGRRGEILLHRREETTAGSRVISRVREESAVIDDGRLAVEIAGILPGDYQVEVVLDIENAGERLWMPGTRDRAESPWYRVGADSVTEVSAQLAPAPARLEGSVTGAWQALGLTEWPTVSIVTVDSVTVVSRRPVFPDGRFAIDLHVPGPVKVLVSQSYLERWLGGPGFAGATVYDPQPGETISGLDVVQSGLRLAIAAPDAGPGYAKFSFYDPADLTFVGACSASLEAGAEVGIANLWPGQYLLRISQSAGSGPVEVLGGSATWRPQWFDRAATAAEARLVTIAAPGQIVPLDVTLERGGVISGRVAQSGEVPTSHQVLLTPADASVVLQRELVWWSLTDGFALRGLPDGDYRIGACGLSAGVTLGAPPPAGTMWYPGTTDWTAAAVLQIRDAGVIADLVLPAP